MTKILSLFVFVLSSATTTISQEPTKEKNYFFLETGLTFRSTMLNISNIGNGRPDNAFIPFTVEKNVQGFSWTVGLNYVVPRFKVGFSYNPAIRYDYVYHTFLGEPNQRIGQRWDWLPEHHFYFFKYFNHRSKPQRKSFAALGVGIINWNKSYLIPKDIGNGRQRAFPKDIWFDLEFKTIEGKLGTALSKHLWLDFTAYLIPGTFPTDKTQNYMMFSTSLRYNFRRNAFR